MSAARGKADEPAVRLCQRVQNGTVGAAGGLNGLGLGGPPVPASARVGNLGLLRCRPWGWCRLLGDRLLAGLFVGAEFAPFFREGLDISLDGLVIEISVDHGLEVRDLGLGGLGQDGRLALRLLADGFLFELR